MPTTQDLLNDPQTMRMAWRGLQHFRRTHGLPAANDPEIPYLPLVAKDFPQFFPGAAEVSPAHHAHTMTPEGRKRVADAQHKRWEEFHREHPVKEAASHKPARRSAKARLHMSIAQKKRWAKHRREMAKKK